MILFLDLGKRSCDASKEEDDVRIGFNDKGESIPFQGGTNEEVVDRLYKILRKDKKEQFLKVYWSVSLRFLPA